MNEIMVRGLEYWLISFYVRHFDEELKKRILQGTGADESCLKPVNEPLSDGDLHRLRISVERG